MKLTRTQFKELQEALLSAFPRPQSLREMVRIQLDENLLAIAGGEDLNAQVFNLIEWAKAQGKVEELVRGACKQNPGNPKLKEFCCKYFKKNIPPFCAPYFTGRETELHEGRTVISGDGNIIGSGNVSKVIKQQARDYAIQIG